MRCLLKSLAIFFLSCFLIIKFQRVLCVHWLATLFQMCLCPWQTFPLRLWLVFSLFRHHLSRSRIVWPEPGPASQSSPSWTVPVANLRSRLHAQRPWGSLLCDALGVDGFRWYSRSVICLELISERVYSLCLDPAFCPLMLTPSSGVCRKACLRSIVSPLFFCQKSVDCMHVGLSGGSPWCLIIYLSVLSLMPLFVGYYSFTLSLEIEQCKPYNFILLQYCVGYSFSFPFLFFCLSK